MKNSNDLQFYLDNTPLEVVNKLSDTLENHNIEKHADNTWSLIQQVWEQETGTMLDHEKMNNEEVDKIFFDLQTLVAIYVGCRRGYMKITNGRLILSDPNNATFLLTPRGMNYVENKLGKKK